MMERREMKLYSIRLKMTVTLVITFALAIILSLVVNKVFLPSFYQYSKLKALNTAYEQIRTIITQANEKKDPDDGGSVQFPLLISSRNIMFNYGNMLPDESQSAINQLIEENSIKAFIYHIRENMFISPDVLLFNGNQNEIAEVYSNVFGYYMLDYRMLGSRTEQLKVADGYGIYKMYDDRRETYYIDLLGLLEPSTYILLRTNFVSIQESADIANNFFSYVGLVAIVVSGMLIYVINRSLTKPLLDMSRIAKKMTNLDFEAVYPVTTRDEIGELGSSLNQLSKKLESTITELKSANNELMNDIKKKTEIDEMRKDFLSNVTHELKTPIALIQGYAEGLRENTYDDEESREFYQDVIIDEAMKMNDMVKKLLSLSHIESGTSFEMNRFDITEVVLSVLQSFDILIRQKNTTVLFDKYEPIYVWADEYLIEEALTNYISNAINHVSGANVIEISLVKLAERVRVVVFNTGECIPECDLDKVWIKFYKIDKARTREYGGSGIGLSIVKAIMDSHNRPYGVVNRDTGVEFWFELDYKNS